MHAQKQFTNIKTSLTSLWVRYVCTSSQAFDTISSMLRRDPGEPINDHHHHHQRISGSRPTDPLPTGGSGRGHYQFLGYFNVEIPYFRGIL